MIVIEIIYWVVFIYGFLCIVQDLITEFTYKKYNKNCKVYVCIKDFENSIEDIQREIVRIKWQFKNISINVVNMDKKVDNAKLIKFFEDTSIRVLSEAEFYESSKTA